MGIGNIITKMASYVSHTKAGKGLTAAVTKKKRITGTKYYLKS